MFYDCDENAMIRPDIKLNFICHWSLHFYFFCFTFSFFFFSFYLSIYLDTSREYRINSVQSFFLNRTSLLFRATVENEQTSLLSCRCFIGCVQTVKIVSQISKWNVQQRKRQVCTSDFFPFHKKWKIEFKWSMTMYLFLATFTQAFASYKE